jgi:hypothetical protein
VRRRQVGSIAFDQIFDDQSGLGERLPLILDDRRFAERVYALHFIRRQHGLLVAFVARDLVGNTQLLQEPEDPLAARIVQMVDTNHLSPPGKRPKAANSKWRMAME